MNKMRPLVDCTFRLSVCLVCIGIMLSGSALGQTTTPPGALLPGQSATLLPDGRWLVAGGIAKGSALLRDAELWDTLTGTVTKLNARLSSGRRDQTATLLSDGRVALWGGHDQHGTALLNGELFDSLSQTFTPIDVLP